MLTVNEIFHSIQGESTRAGEPCVFVRLTGCNLRCVWCDTAYAFHEGQPMTIAQVLDEVGRFGCALVEITGGEPLLQPDAVPLMAALLEREYRVMVETGGSLPIDRLPEGVARILDVKCPGSGEADRNHWENLRQLRGGDEVKFVIKDRADYLWARERVDEHGLTERCPVLFSPVHGELPARRLAEWILEDRLPVRLQLQLHKFLWPELVRGV